MSDLSNIIHSLGFVKSLSFLAEELEYGLNVTNQNLTGIRFNFVIPNQVMRGSVKLNLKEVTTPKSWYRMMFSPDRLRLGMIYLHQK